MKETEAKTMKWYIIRTQVNREKSVAEKILKESEVGDLVGRIGKIVVPTEKKYSVKGGKKIMKEQVMFPGYIFIQIGNVAELKNHIRGFNGVSGFLTNRAGEIQPLKNEEVERMIGHQKEMMENQMSDVFIPEEEVKILEGPFAGFFGTIETIKDQKVRVIVSIFDRKTPVELNINQIEKSTKVQ
jgi:transcriptional antiterminator NusG